MDRLVLEVTKVREKGPTPIRRSARVLGFTLIEMMLVVAIIMVGLSLAFWTTVEGQRQAKVADVSRSIVRNLELARSLSKGIPGDRLRGEANCHTNSFGNCANLASPGADDCFPWIKFDPTTHIVTIPQRVVWNGNLLQTECEEIDVRDAHNEGVNLPVVLEHSIGNSPVRIAFMPNGRVVVDSDDDGTIDAISDPFVFRIEKRESGAAQTVESYQYRVLPSGVVCRTANSAASVAANAACDMEKEAG